MNYPIADNIFADSQLILNFTLINNITNIKNEKKNCCRKLEM
jgi:hypothetical protein